MYPHVQVHVSHVHLTPCFIPKLFLPKHIADANILGGNRSVISAMTAINFLKKSVWG